MKLPEVCILRLGYRLVRDERISTHLGLVGRAFGAKKIYFSPAEPSVKLSVDKVTKRWGGEFEVILLEKWKPFVKEWQSSGGIVVHLTMYGIQIEKAINEISASTKKLLVVVGGAKVPGEIYHFSDFNVAVTNQPHSEVAALAVFLDRFHGGKELKQKFGSEKLRIKPSPHGRVVIARTSSVR